MNFMITLLDKPEYFYQPARIANRVGIALGLKSRAPRAQLPWGLEIETMEGDSLDHLLQRVGIFDLIVTEVLWRLAVPGSVAVDCGANIGYMSSLLAHRLGAAGQVHAFEPGLGVLPVFTRNAQHWSRTKTLAPVTVHGCAVADRVGTAFFQDSAVESVVGRLDDGAGGDRGRPVPVTTLDITLSELLREKRVSVLKIDTEGAELMVLKGAHRILEEGKVANIVFEDYEKYPTPVMRELEGMGYVIFALSRSFRRVELLPPTGDARLRGWESPNYLATRDPKKTQASFARPGWGCLGADIGL